MQNDAAVEIYRLQVARRRLSRLVSQVANGACVIITKHGRTIAKMVAADESVFALLPQFRVLRAGQSMTARSDTAIGLLLALIDRHIAEQPECLRFVDESLLLRIDALIQGVAIDLDSPLSAADE
ncbi:type II toxin-antitoxin system PrlF family antitoxin [Pseudomonas sp. NY15436]|uniref:type II toxin-antitoxin system PrlF family antitoxin n=1 Tax=Pseudomonas sp. NY15436 TaxID=3400359 RepID=UPI003A85197A